MKTQHVESMEELVFKNKNKLYGAYLLRRKYQKHLVISLLFGLFLLFSAISYPLIAAYLHPAHRIYSEPGGGVIIVGGLPPADEPPPPPPPPPDLVTPERIRLLTPVVVDKDVDNDLVLQDDLDNQPLAAVPPEIMDLPPVDNSKNTIEQPVAPQEPWISVEIPPEFPGGETELFKYLKDNLRYPAEAKELGVTGRVFVYFVVEPDGTISSLNVKRGIGAGCDEEALRVVGLMPRWSPGKQGGVAVRVQFTLPVKFTLQ